MGTSWFAHRKTTSSLSSLATPSLVLRIDDGIATIAPDEQFPYSVTSKLAGALKSNGIPRVYFSAVTNY
ncbi:hypothetical protein LF1_58790 [Rubripirellula obstinata]|uniref:Uncharacterized protein n=1 Tax=Rubripirellula obstinata TaxID=406547 RepID=A0A5B1CB07_9BACT|nr:hypothetical protein LF1_58790 [Rubripirellula obstinata]